MSCHPGHIPPCKMPAWSLVPSLGSASSLGVSGDSGAGPISASRGGHPTAVTIRSRTGLQAWRGGAWGYGSGPGQESGLCWASGLTPVESLHWREPWFPQTLYPLNSRGPSNLRGFCPGFRKELQSFQQSQRSRDQRGKGRRVGQPGGLSESQLQDGACRGELSRGGGPWVTLVGWARAPRSM